MDRKAPGEYKRDPERCVCRRRWAQRALRSGISSERKLWTAMPDRTRERESKLKKKDIGTWFKWQSEAEYGQVDLASMNKCVH